LTIDPYAGIRTRENIVEVDAEFNDNALRAALMRNSPHREALAVDGSMPNLDDDVVFNDILHPAAFTAGSRAYECNLVPAEDVPAHERIAQLKQLVEDMFADWCKLNEIYNITAKQRDWCSDYEERQANYNEQFKVLRLVGRPNNWYGSTSNWKTLDGSDYGCDG